MEKEYTQKYLQINRNRNIIFDADKMPFFSVAPELSDLGKSFLAGEQFDKSFSSLNFNEAYVADGAVIIQDIIQKGGNTEFLQKVRELNRASSITLQIVDGTTLTKNMLQLLKQTNTFATDPVIIVPGNGAESVAEYITTLSPKLLKKSYRLTTKRTMIKPGKFELSVDYSSLPTTLPSQNILILDDVVASGQTASTIGAALINFYPNVKIDLATWLYLWPTEKDNIQAPSGVNNIDTTTASVALKANYSSRPPINSLSCLLMDDVLSQQKLAVFTSKYASNPQLFKALLEEVRDTL